MKAKNLILSGLSLLFMTCLVSCDSDSSEEGPLYEQAYDRDEITEDDT